MRFTFRTTAQITCLLICEFSVVAAQAAKESPSRSTVPIDPFSAESLFRMFGGLSLVLVMVVLLVWVLKRLQKFPAGTGGYIQLVGALSLGQREKVVVVQLGDEQLVLGVCAGRIDFLHALKNPIPVARHPDISESFSEKLRDVLEKRIKQ